MTTLSTYVASATLMHTSLAYLSAEVQTLDSVICNKTTAHFPSLPIELLLLIRSQLLSSITNDLFALSNSALAHYEARLLSLLCSDCINYNSEVFGPDIWQWANFKGPCTCTEPYSRSNKRLDEIVPGLSTFNPNPKQFTSPLHWLENHLSLALKGNHHPSYLASPLTVSDAVSQVLRDHDCEILTPSNRRSFNVNLHGLRWPSQSPQHRRNTTVIVPIPSAVQREVEVNGHNSVSGTKIILERVERNLCLSLSYEGHPRWSAWSAPQFPTVVKPHPSRSTTNPLTNNCELGPCSILAVAQLLSATTEKSFSMLCAVASLPLTLLCYYSRPCAFRAF